MHNLIGLIRSEAAYTTLYGAAFLKPTRVGEYDAAIDNNATAVIHACTEAAHRENCADRATYETARQDTAQFILAVIEDTWVRELQETKNLYTDIKPKALVSQLQAVCTGRHSLDLLAHHTKCSATPLK